MSKAKVIYAAVFLDGDSTEKLAHLAKHETVWAHHMTIAFSPAQELIDKLPMGEEVELTGITVADDGTCQAMGVLVHSTVIDLVENARPHITISCAKGISPVHSNDILPGSILPPWDRPRLIGHVGVFTSDKEVKFSL